MLPKRFFWASLLLPCLACTPASDSHEKGEEPKGEGDQGAEKLEDVPLKGALATFRQVGFGLVEGNESKEVHRKWKYLLERYQTGACNAHLVRAKDLATLLEQTHRADLHERSGEGLSPIGRDQPVWLVAFLGLGDAGQPAWTVASVQKGAATVRISVNRGSTRAGKHPHFAWVPLPDLPPGRYSVQLADAQTGKMKVSRRMRLP
jgi:hypothetical protein